MEFVVIESRKAREEVTQVITEMGGMVGTKVHNKVVAIISNREIVAKMEFQMMLAKKCDIQVIPIDILWQFHVKDPIQCIIDGNISDWGSDVSVKTIIIYNN